MPFGPYDSWEQCVAENSGKDDPEAYCAVIKRAIEGSEFAHVDLGDGKVLLTHMEIFATGFHVPAEGEARNWSPDDLRDVVKAYRDDVLKAPVYLKVGHTSDAFCAKVAAKLGVPVEVVKGEGPAGDGMISLGRMLDLRLRDDGVLVSDWEVPEQVADLIEKGYTDVSAEMLMDYAGYPYVLSAVALLGAERPAVKTLEGLEDMAVLVERQPALVARFKAGAGRLKFDQPRSELDELEEVNAAMQAVIKGKKSAQMLQGIWEQVKQKWEALLGRSGLRNPQMEESEVDLKTLAQKLGMAEKAEYQEEEVLSRLDALMGLLGQIAEAMGLGAPAEAPPEEMPEMAEKAKEMAAKAKEVDKLRSGAKFSEAQYSEKLQAAEGRIAALERDKRMAQYRELVRPFTAVEGKPDDLAAELIAVEDKLGKEAVDKQVARFAAAQKYAEQAGVLTRIGTSQGDDSGLAPLEIEMRDWASKNEKTMAEAYAHFRETQPAKWNEFRRSTHNGG